MCTSFEYDQSKVLFLPVCMDGPIDRVDNGNFDFQNSDGHGARCSHIGFELRLWHHCQKGIKYSDY